LETGFIRPDAFPVTQPAVLKQWRNYIHTHSHIWTQRGSVKVFRMQGKMMNTEWLSFSWMMRNSQLNAVNVVCFNLWSDHIYFHPVVCSSFFLLFSLPNLSGRRLDVYHTSTHGVALVRIYIGCRSETCCTRLAGNAGCKKLPSAHHHTTLSAYIFATKARIDNRKRTC